MGTMCQCQRAFAAEGGRRSRSINQSDANQGPTHDVNLSVIPGGCCDIGPEAHLFLRQRCSDSAAPCSRVPSGSGGFTSGLLCAHIALHNLK